NRCLCPSEGGLVLFDCGFDSSKAGSHGGDGVLLQGSHIAARRHFEIALGRGFEPRAYRDSHVRGALAGLGVGRCSEQQQPQPSPWPASSSFPKREFWSSTQRESLRWHFT